MKPLTSSPLAASVLGHTLSMPAPRQSRQPQSRRVGKAFGKAWEIDSPAWEGQSRAAQASPTTVRDLAAQLGVSAGTAQKLAHLKEG